MKLPIESTLAYFCAVIGSFKYGVNITGCPLPAIDSGCAASGWKPGKFLNAKAASKTRTKLISINLILSDMVVTPNSQIFE